MTDESTDTPATPAPADAPPKKKRVRKPRAPKAAAADAAEAPDADAAPAKKKRVRKPRTPKVEADAEAADEPPKKKRVRKPRTAKAEAPEADADAAPAKKKRVRKPRTPKVEADAEATDEAAPPPEKKKRVRKPRASRAKAAAAEVAPAEAAPAEVEARAEEAPAAPDAAPAPAAAPAPTPAAPALVVDKEFEAEAEAIAARCAAAGDALDTVERDSVFEILEDLRKAAERSLPWAERIKTLQTFLDWAEEDENAPIPDLLCTVARAPRDGGAATLRQECWLPSGVAADHSTLHVPAKNARERSNRRLMEGSLVVVDQDDLDGDTVTARPRRRDAGVEDILLGRTWPAPMPASEHITAPAGVFGWAWVHHAEADFVEGPYRVRRGGVLSTKDNDSSVARMPFDTFVAIAGIGHRFPAEEQRALTWRAPKLEDLAGRPGVEIIEAAPDEEFKAWAEQVFAWEALDDEKRASRMRRLGRVADDADGPFAVARERAIAEWMERPETQERLETRVGDRVESALQDAVAAREADVRAATETTQAELDALLGRKETLQAEEDAARSALQARLADVEASSRAARAELEERLQNLKEQIAAAEALRRDAKWKLTQSIVLDGVPRGVVDEPLPSLAAPVAVRPIADALGDDPTHAALVAALLCNRFVLAVDAGGPSEATGVGGVLTSLGHGPAGPRALVVRARSGWTDDRAAFGRWDPAAAIWEPSTEGVLEHLLQAQGDPQGLYTVIAERFGASPPEAWLGRLLGGARAVRLRGDHLQSRNGARYPATLEVGDNVRVIGRIEALSGPHRPSRALLAEAWTTSTEGRDAAATTPVDWADLRSQAAACAAVDAPGLSDATRLLPGAVSWTAGGLGAELTRFIGVAATVMEVPEAVDFAVAWRLLPPLSLDGPDGLERLDALRALAHTHRWGRTLQAVDDIAAHGARLGGFYEGLVLPW